MNITKKIFLFLLITKFSIAQVDWKLFLEKAFITDIKQVGNYLLVATYGQGIYQLTLSNGSWKNFSTKSGDVNNDLFHCVESSSQFIWAGSNEGLFIYNKKNQKWTVKKFHDGGEFGNWIRALYFDKKRDLLWIGRFRNITMFDLKANSYREFNRVIDGNEKTNNINSISADGDSVIWFGAEYGVHKLILDKKNQFDNWSYFNNKGRSFLGEGEMVSVSDVLPFKNSIWFATEEFVTKDKPNYNIGGIYIYNRKFDWKRISKSDGLPGNGIFNFIRIGNYILTGVYEFNEDNKIELGKGIALINITNHKVNSIDLNQLQLKSAEIRVLYFDGTYIWLGLKIKLGNSLAKWGVK
jgi:hypothetical protein